MILSAKKFRIMMIKLNLIHHILSDKDALAFQVQEVQEKLNLPGLTLECKEYFADLNLPNIFEIKISKSLWKQKVKNAIEIANEKELRHDLLKYKKIKNSTIKDEPFGMKQYVQDLAVAEARSMFKHWYQMTQYVKMNYKNDSSYSKSLWKCDHCKMMDSESHLCAFT